eukprot:gene27772-17912_t
MHQVVQGFVGAAAVNTTALPLARSVSLAAIAATAAAFQAGPRTIGESEEQGDRTHRTHSVNTPASVMSNLIVWADHVCLAPIVMPYTGQRND